MVAHTSPVLLPTLPVSAGTRRGSRTRANEGPITPTRSPTTTPASMPSLEPIVESSLLSDDEGEVEGVFRDDFNGLADSFEYMGMRWVRSHGRVCRYSNPAPSDSSDFAPSPPPLAAPPSTPPSAAAPPLTPPSAAARRRARAPPPVYANDGLPAPLREWLESKRSSKLYVVTEGFYTGVFDNWHQTGLYVNGYPKNRQKGYERSEVDQAFGHWSENCLEGTLKGEISHHSLVGRVLPGSSPGNTAPATAPLAVHTPPAGHAGMGTAYNAPPVAPPAAFAAQWMGPIRPDVPAVAYQVPMMGYYPNGTLLMQPGVTAIPISLFAAPFAYAPVQQAPFTGPAYAPFTGPANVPFTAFAGPAHVPSAGPEHSSSITPSAASSRGKDPVEEASGSRSRCDGAFL